MVGDIESVKVKAEEIAREVARNKALRGDVQEDNKKAKKGEEKVVKRDMTNPINMMPCPQPTESSDDIRRLLKELVEKCEAKDLAYAAKLKATSTPGELSMFSSFLFYVFIILILCFHHSYFMFSSFFFSFFHTFCLCFRRWLEIPKRRRIKTNLC
jgi:hypothetical protein